MITNKRKVEVFSAGCPACVETVKLVQQIACSSCEVEVLDMQGPPIRRENRACCSDQWKTRKLLQRRWA